MDNSASEWSMQPADVDAESGYYCSSTHRYRLEWITTSLTLSRYDPSPQLSSVSNRWSIADGSNTPPTAAFLPVYIADGGGVRLYEAGFEAAVGRVAGSPIVEIQVLRDHAPHGALQLGRYLLGCWPVGKRTQWSLGWEAWYLLTDQRKCTDTKQRQPAIFRAPVSSRYFTC